VEAISAVRTGYSLEWLAVMLWCPREETDRRLIERGDARRDQRLTVWDETLDDVHTVDPGVFDLVINTATYPPADAAELVDLCHR
jgi:guanylate kinase